MNTDEHGCGEKGCQERKGVRMNYSSSEFLTPIGTGKVESGARNE